jgi:hypothetical protein
MELRPDYIDRVTKSYFTAVAGGSTEATEARTAPSKHSSQPPDSELRKTMQSPNQGPMKLANVNATSANIQRDAQAKLHPLIGSKGRSQ